MFWHYFPKEAFEKNGHSLISYIPEGFFDAAIITLSNEVILEVWKDTYQNNSEEIFWTFHKSSLKMGVHHQEEKCELPGELLPYECLNLNNLLGCKSCPVTKPKVVDFSLEQEMFLLMGLPVELRLVDSKISYADYKLILRRIARHSCSS